MYMEGMIRGGVVDNRPLFRRIFHHAEINPPWFEDSVVSGKEEDAFGGIVKEGESHLPFVDNLIIGDIR